MGTACQSEVFTEPPELPILNPHHDPHLGEIEVTREEACNAAERLLKRYAREVPGRGCRSLPVAVLNMANGELCGSGLLHGSPTAEVELCRRSDLYSQLQSVEYPLGSKVVYTRDVPVFRSDRKELYAIREEAFSIAVLSAAAPPIDTDNYLEALRAHIEFVLAICIARGHTVLVLGPWGCGDDFPANPREAALVFRDVLKSNRFMGRFRCVTFAVPDTEGTTLCAADFESVLVHPKRRLQRPA